MSHGKRIVGALIVTIGLLATVACSAPGDTGGGSEEGPIKIGFIYPATGVFAAPGQFMLEGFELFLKQNDNQIAGREVELVRADTKGDPNVMLTQARRLVEREQVDFLFGPLSAAEGAALMPFLRQRGVAAVYPIASTDDITQRTPSELIARTGWSSSQTTHPFGEYAYDELGYRRVATIGFDFSFSWESVGGFVQTFQEKGGTVVRELWAPIGTTDYSPYLSTIPNDVDAVFVSFSGSAAVQFINQYDQFGLKAPLIAQGNTTDESTLEETGPAAEGIVSTLHYSAAIDSPENQEFVSAYEQEYGHVPSYYAENTYTAGLLIDQALDSLGGGFSEPEELVKAIEESTIDAPRGPLEFDEYGNPIQNVYVRKVETVDGALQNTVIDNFENVSQFWTYDPEEYLKNPTYTRRFPECNGC